MANYNRQLCLKIKGVGDHQVVTKAADDLATKAGRKGISCRIQELDPNAPQEVAGRIKLSDELTKDIAWLSEDATQKSRLYIITHGTKNAAQNVGGTMAASLVELICGCGKCKIARIGLIVCHGGNDFSGGLYASVAEQMCVAFSRRKVTTIEISSYLYAISIAPPEFEKVASERDGKDYKVVGAKYAWKDDKTLLPIRPNQAEFKTIYYISGGKVQRKEIPRRSEVDH